MNTVTRHPFMQLLACESIGRGDDVVLLHGWGMHAAYWQDMLTGLQDRFRLHCIDLPGHGRSTYLEEQALDEFVERVRQTIEGITTQAVHLIGWSLGGLISQRLAALHPDMLKRLILIASSASFVRRENWPHAMQPLVLNEFAELLRRDYMTTLMRFLALQVWKSEDQKQALRDLKAQIFSRGEPDQHALSAGLQLLQQTDLRDTLVRIDKPVMLLGGERDTLVPARALPDMADRLNHAVVHIIKGAGHAPFLSHSDEVVSLIRGFLEHE